MVSALGRRRLPFVALVHDPELHPGDGLPFQARLQRAVFQKAAALAVLTSHTAERVSMLGLVGSRPLIRLSLPPIPFPMPPVASRPPGSPLHVLVFGRLLEYKGLDILADALAGLGTDPEMVVRIVGRGNESPELQRLRSLPRVTVENRGVPEDEVGDLFGWCDAVVLPYTEASQSGVLATAIATGRAVLATNVGGLPEQLSGYARGLVCDPDAAGLLDGLRRLPALARDTSVPLIEPEAAWREMAAFAGSSNRRTASGRLRHRRSRSREASPPNTGNGVIAREFVGRHRRSVRPRGWRRPRGRNPARRHRDMSRTPAAVRIGLVVAFCPAQCASRDSLIEIPEAAALEMVSRLTGAGRAVGDIILDDTPRARPVEPRRRSLARRVAYRLPPDAQHHLSRALRRQTEALRQLGRISRSRWAGT